MSDNVALAGFSIKLDKEDQNENRLKEIAKSLGHIWTDNFEWEDILYGSSNYINKWKPHMDINGTYGFIMLKHYEYCATDIEFYSSISESGLAVKDYVDQTMILPNEQIKTFALIYYNGSDCPFKF